MEQSKKNKKKIKNSETAAIPLEQLHEKELLSKDICAPTVFLSLPFKWQLSNVNYFSFGNKFLPGNAAGVY